MTEALQFLAPAFAMCVVVAALHVYLGMHILEREVIFVDLSLAQLAALGATVAQALGAAGELRVRASALLFTLTGAAIFALAGRARRHVSQEAIVGIVYAVSSALMILALSRSPHGGEEIKDILAGSLLVTTWEQVRFAALAYAVLGAIHLGLARRFVRISWQREEAERSLRWLGLWDFTFYALFGIAITISVQVAGVLLVFSYLIVPAVITRFFSGSMRVRLVLGWAVALGASVLGLWSSWAWDLPTGAAVVAAFGMLLLLAGALAFGVRKRSAA